MKGTLLFILFLFAGCSTWYATSRSDYRLVKQDGFLISNIYVHPTDIDVDKNHIAFNYIVVVKNIDKKEKRVDLKDSSITIGLRKLTIPCASYEKNEQAFSLAQNEKLTILCKVVLNKKEGMFQIGDYKSLIEIPLDNTVAKFAYLLRAEDFQ